MTELYAPLVRRFFGLDLREQKKSKQVEIIADLLFLNNKNLLPDGGFGGAKI